MMPHEAIRRQEFIRWRRKRLSLRFRCVIERTFSCIPLERDEICFRCFRREKEMRLAKREAVAK